MKKRTARRDGGEPTGRFAELVESDFHGGLKEWQQAVRKAETSQLTREQEGWLFGNIDRVLPLRFSAARGVATGGPEIRMAIHIGTSGWNYDHWGDVLYPPGLPSRDRLFYYTQSFQTVELNSSFYRWPRLAIFRGWRRRLPNGFQFSVKAPRGLTHAKRLYAPEAWLERIAACWRELGDKRAGVVGRSPTRVGRCGQARVRLLQQ